MGDDMPPPVCSIIVPCYNEKGAILGTIAAIRSAVAGVGDCEIIVVNDGSTDGCRALLDGAQEKDPALKVVHHPQNQGYGAALKTGIRRATAGLIAITDADGTYPNERLPQLIALGQQCDMAVGARTGGEVAVPFLRRFPKALLRRYASWLAGQPIPDINSGLRVFKKDVAERFFSILPDTFSFTTTITLAMLTKRYDVRYLPIDYRPRLGKSKIRPIRDTLLFFQLLVRTAMYFAPLRVLSPLIVILSLGFMTSLADDVFVLKDLTEKTLMLLLFAMNTAIFALLADMIDKRSGG
jgi:glycosyltransferase involved in cell wall biosynthesis